MKSADYTRAQRIADQIAREVAIVLLSEVSDPRARGVTVSDVDLSPDRRNAVIYVTCPREADEAEVLSGLNSAAAFIRRRLADTLRMKVLPSLRFAHDASLNRANRIDELLRGEES